MQTRVWERGSASALRATEACIAISQTYGMVLVSRERPVCLHGCRTNKMFGSDAIRCDLVMHLAMACARCNFFEGYASPPHAGASAYAPAFLELSSFNKDMAICIQNYSLIVCLDVHQGISYDSDTCDANCASHTTVCSQVYADRQRQPGATGLGTRPRTRCASSSSRLQHHHLHHPLTAYIVH